MWREPPFGRSGRRGTPARTPCSRACFARRDGWRRMEAATAIGVRGKAEAASTLQWVAAADSDRDVVSAAVGALAQHGFPRRAGRDCRNRGADRAHGRIRTCARRSSPSLAGLPQRRIDDVAKGLGHPSPDVRRATIEALSRMKHPKASRSVESALDDAVPAVRATAVAELRRLGSRHAARKLLTLARTDPDLAVRQAAVMAVTQHGGHVDADRPEAR